MIEGKNPGELQKVLEGLKVFEHRGGKDMRPEAQVIPGTRRYSKWVGTEFEKGIGRGMTHPCLSFSCGSFRSFYCSKDRGHSLFRIRRLRIDGKCHSPKKLKCPVPFKALPGVYN